MYVYVSILSSYLFLYSTFHLFIFQLGVLSPPYQCIVNAPLCKYRRRRSSSHPPVMGDDPFLLMCVCKTMLVCEYKETSALVEFNTT